EVGFFLSIDGGREWRKLMTGLPTIRVDDILIHPRDNDVIIGTHGLASTSSMTLHRYNSLPAARCLIPRLSCLMCGRAPSGSTTCASVDLRAVQSCFVVRTRPRGRRSATT